MSINEPIAIVGSGCRFPGQSSSPSKLWDLLSQPRDVLKEIPPSRFDARGFYNADGNTNGHSNILHSYVLDEDIRAWDADFFSVSANEAVAIDPQQRLLMETVYEALEAGGQLIRDLRDSDTAVYVGLMGEEYSAIQGRELNNLPTYMATGVARSIVANRISYFFGWHGPSMTIDTACSSSLVAVHQAVQVLRSGTSRVAIAAGTNLLLSMEPYITESTFHMLSPRGRSHMWDADADGYGRGDGVATVILKRLSDAIADGDAIECVIRETGVNQDGRTNGITVPSADAQVALIQDTYRRAGLDLDSPEGRPQFFEAHGTGTQTGDPLEAEAIHRAIGQRLGSDKLYVGSIKTIIGHTEGTAGIVGLLKASLALKHGIIPPNMLFQKLNPSVQPFYQGLQVPSSAIPWPKAYPRRASVNSFGFGGTNAHAIVEAYEKPKLTTSPLSNAASSSWYLTPYVFSAVTKASLRRRLQDALSFLESSPSVTASDLAYTLNVRRSVFPHRASYAARSVPQLRERLREALALPDWETSAVTRLSPAPVQILGVFTGQGAQWAGMGRQLFEDFPFAAARIRELETALVTLPVADRPSWSLLAELQADASKSRLHRAEFAQPLCTALQIVLVDLLAAANVRFHAVVGHSSGEIGAAYAAGVLSARHAMLVAYYRGRHTNLARGPTGQKGTMLAVGTTPEDAREIIELPRFEGRLCLAACNSPTSVTLSGDSDAIEQVQAAFEDEGKFARAIRVDKAYHSHHMQPCTLRYIEALRRASVEATSPRQGCRWYSSVVERAVNTEELNNGYWARNMAQTVLFSGALENAMAHHSFTMAVEVGPHGTLKGPAQDTMAAVDRPIAAYISCLTRNTDSSDTFSNALGQVWANAPEGTVDFDRFHITVHGPSGARRTLLTALPQYPWDNKRTFWHESRRSRALRLRREPGHPLLGTITPESSETHLQWHHVLRVFELPWLSGHQLQGQTVFPAAGYVAMAIEAARHLSQRVSRSVRIIELEDLTIGRAIPFENEKTGVEVAFSLDINSINDRSEERFIAAGFEVRSSSGTAIDTVLNASGHLRLSMSMDEGSNNQELLPHRDTEPSRMVVVNNDEFYEELKKLGYNYSGRFRALGSMRRRMGLGRGQIAKGALADLHPSEEELLVHPGYLDAAFQATFLAYAWPGDGQLWSLHVPVSIRRIRINAAQWQTHAGASLDFDAAITGQGLVEDQPGIVADIDLFPGNGSHAMAQIEGVRVVPFAAGTEEKDVPLFYVNSWGPTTPDAELVEGKDSSSAEDIALANLLERLANLYLCRLSEAIASDEEGQVAWHHQQLVAYARHASQQSMVNPKWKHDTLETLQPLLEQYQDTVDVRLLHRAGENLVAAIRGKADLVDEMQQDDLLAQWYLKSLGLGKNTQYLSETVGQISHINPHLRVLHIRAGSGGMARSVLHRIGGAFQQYTLTDPSPDAVEKARVLLSADQEATSARTHFQSLDISQDVREQGFADHSFQLIIGTLALQSTTDVSSALTNIRRLLQPGGYLVLLESRAPHPHRLTVTLGGLEPYWRGAENGRPRSVSVAGWHALLSQTGFTGVDTSTPESNAMVNPYTVLVSRATDEHINRLLEPSLVPSLIEGLTVVIITGRSLESIRLGHAAARILKPFSESIMTVQALDLLAAADLMPGVTVLYLGDLDKPAFEDLSPDTYAGLQALYANGRNILWITRGARRDRPHAKMSLGLARALMVEQVYSRLHCKVIDLGPGVRADVHMVVDELLRLYLLANPIKGQPELLWTDEPEVEVDTDGRVWAPRVVPHRGFNDGYNSTRRSIMSQARPSHEAVEIYHHGHKRSLLRILAPEARRSDDAELVTVHVLYTATLPLPVSSINSWYACVGRENKTGRLVLTVASSIASMVEVPPQWTITLTHGPNKAPARLRAITAHVFGALICGQADLNAGLILVEPDETTASIVALKCGQNGVSITCVTSSPRKRSSGFVYIHPYASVREIRKALPFSLTKAIFFGAPEQLNNTFSERLVAALPEGTQLEKAESLAGSLSSQALFDMLRGAVQSEPQVSPNTNVVSVEDYIGHQQPTTAIVDWRQQETVPLAVQPSDTLSLLRGDRTYLLIGLAGSGGLGLSLAQYLVGLGARHLILTSRNPNVDTKLVAELADKGVTIEFKANDVTDRCALDSLVDEVRALWPPIAGVANGAMVLNDVGFENMTYEQMTRVLRPKVDGSRYLDEIFHDDPLDFFVMLSSVSCVHGRSGQANYDAANMYMVGLAAQRRARGVAASVIDLGAIVGTGVIARDVNHHVLNNLVASGYRKMSERDFLISFANAILVGRAQSDESEELIAGMTLNPRGGRFQPVWHENARFAHLMLNTDQPAQSTGSAGQKESTEALLKRSNSPNDVRQVVQAAVIEKLATMLHLSQEATSDQVSLLQQSTSVLGVDSLSAVEIRRWMQGELEVDIPVLQILADASVQSVVDFAVEHLPKSMTPGLDPNGEDAITTEALTKPNVDPPASAIAPVATSPSEGDTTSVQPAMTVTVGQPMPSPGPVVVEDDNTSTFSDSQSQLTPSKSSQTSSVGMSQHSVPSPSMDKVMPMSFGQARFWVMQQIVEDPCAFNISCDIEINAAVDIPRFVKAFESLGDRHEGLRTCFFNEDNHQPMQGILKDSSVRLETVRADPSEVDRYFDEIHRTAFSPSKGNLLRAILITSSPSQHHLLVGYHHINMDSTSFVVLMSDLVRLYAGQKLSPPQLQYADFALHQLERLRNGHWDAHLAYWRREYAQLPDPLPILNVSAKTTRPRPNLTTYANIDVETRVPARIARQIQSVCRSVQVTPFHLYTTVLQVLLARLTSTTDICIGMADANRAEMGATDSVGNFLNLLPVRLETSLNRPFAELLRSAKRQVLAALSHSPVPFDVILEQISVQRSATHSPLFQAFIDYRHVTEKLPFGNGHLEGKRYRVSKTPYDVMLEMIDTPTGEASLKILVQQGLYTRAEAETILSCYMSLLDAFTRDHHQSAGSPTMYEAKQVQDALRLGQGELLELKNASFLTEMDAITAVQPTSIALEDSDGNSLRWSEMKSKTVALGHRLAQLSLPPHSRVGVFQEPTVDWVCSMFGIWRAQYTYVPLETSQGLARLAAVAKEAQLAALVVDDSTVSRVAQLGLGSETPVVNASSLSWTLSITAPSPTLSLEDEAIVIYTSGSTGVPKGISIPHRVIVNSLESLLHRWPMSPQTVLQQTALSFDVSWWGALLGLATKGRVVVAGRNTRGDPRALTNLIISKHVTLTFAVPSESVAWLTHANAEALQESSWAYHFSGGEPYSRSLIEHLQTLNKPSLRAINIYGPTETMIPNAHEVLYRTISASDLPIPIGRVMPNYTARVVDEQGHPVPAGVSGHLVYGGPGIARGYTNNPTLTAERFPADIQAPAAFAERGWTQIHLSGDRGYLRAEDGVFMLQARIDGDTQVKLRGLRIDLMDIEAHLLTSAKGRLRDAVVHVRQTSKADAISEFLVAHVVWAPTGEPHEDFLTQLVRKLQVPDYMRPAIVVPVDALPLTQHGKIDRKAVARLALPEVVDSGYSLSGVAGGSSRLRKMQELWLKVLGEAVRSHVLHPDSDFFLVGGNSLLLIRMQSELKHFGREVPLVELFQRTTLAQMAALGEEDNTNSHVPPTRIDWEQDIRLPPEVTHLRATETPLPATGLVVALTGASGFLGRHLLDHLINRPDIHTVHAVAVRNPTRLSHVSSPKLVVHRGDLSQPSMGLSDAAARQIFSTVHAIIHNGADVSFLKAYSTVRPANFMSTQDIVRLALQYGHVRQVHYVSTAGIATMRTTDLYEQSIGSQPPPSSPEGYILSKWASELYLERASAATGLRVTIHRPTAIVGDGAPHLDVMSNILHYSQRLHHVPAMSALEGSFQFVGVDEVARDVSRAIGNPPATGLSSSLVQYRNHNGAPDDTIDVHSLGDYLTQKLGVAVTALPDAEWIGQAAAAGMPSEVVRYMQGVNLADRQGQKWVFPRALKGEGAGLAPE